MPDNKLLIWDFYGVITDSEPAIHHEWKIYFLEKYSIDLSNDVWDTYLKGISSADKIKQITRLFTVCLGDDDARQCYDMCRAAFSQPGSLQLTKGIENIFKMSFADCIATGAKAEVTADKIRGLGIEKYFPKDSVFTINMVQNGKPAPDLFLFAADKMQFAPQNCIVIEDSLSGVKAAIAAGMHVIPYAEFNQHDSFAQSVNSLGIKNIAKNMQQVAHFLSNIR